MTHRSESEALRARLEQKERELLSARDELDAAGLLLWESRRQRDVAPRGESGPTKGALALLAVLGVGVVTGAMGVWLGYALARRPSSFSFDAVVAQPGSAPELEAGDPCTVTLEVTRDGVLDRTEIRCGATAIDVPRRDVADASDRAVTLDLAHGRLEVRRARGGDVLALRLGEPVSP